MRGYNSHTQRSVSTCADLGTTQLMGKHIIMYNVYLEKTYTFFIDCLNACQGIAKGVPPRKGYSIYTRFLGLVVLVNWSGEPFTHLNKTKGLLIQAVSSIFCSITFCESALLRIQSKMLYNWF